MKQFGQTFVNSRHSITWLALLVTLFMATQCGPLTRPEGGEQDQSTEPGPPAALVDVEPTADTRLTVFYGSHFATDASRNPERILIDQFEADYPEINISRQLIDQNVSLGAIRSYMKREPFTVVLTMWATHEVREAIVEGGLLDLSTLWSDSDLGQTYPDTFLTLGKYEGKQYFWPAFTSWHAIYYNPAVFERHNLTPPETWPEFLQVCEILLENGITPLVYGGVESGLTTVWFDYLNLRLNGPEFHEALMRGEEHFDDRRVADVFETWQFLVESGFVVEDAWGIGVEQARDMVVAEQAGMMLLDSSRGTEDLAFFRFPIIDPNHPIGEVAPTLGYLIPAGIPDQAEALTFLAYLGSAESQWVITEQFGVASNLLPLHKAVDQQTFTVDMKEGLTLIQEAEAISQSYYSHFDDQRPIRTMTRAFRNILLGEGYATDLIELEEIRAQLFD